MQHIRPLSSLSFQKETDLGIGAATGDAPVDPFLFLSLQRSATSKACRPALQQSNFSPDDPVACRPARQQSRSGSTTPTRSSPVPVEKRHHQLAPSVGTTVPLQVKTDHSVTDGINPEHKQEQRPSNKDAGPARRYEQLTSWRVRNNAGQHERGGSTPSHQSTFDRRIRTTHQTDTTTTGDATNSRRP